MSNNIEKFSFQTEVKQLLDLMIHSLYSNKEIFLRELISNASDALDRSRFEEITNKNLMPTEKELSVIIKSFKDDKKIIIEDNGIGMNKEELIANLGTIASSGTRKFMENLKENKGDLNLIGQFGVGFYSAFMVAEKVVVETRSAKDGTAWRWISTANGEYEIEEITRSERGTKIELLLKEDEKEFADDWRIRGIVTKYSDYVTYPIYSLNDKDEQTRLNKSTPVWVKNKKDNQVEDYNELYRQISRQYGKEEPLAYEHISVEGLTPFQAVIYVPSEVPFDLFTKDNHGLHLYVKRVSITEKCKDLLPEYLRFMVGVVETEELPLNVSREILQQNTKIPAIKKQIVKKTFSILKDMFTNDKEKYLKFYEKFGLVLKECFYYDHENHENIAEIALFRSSKTAKNTWITLNEYIERKAENQKEIYYISAPSYEVAVASPHTEALMAKDIEVLFFIDQIDEFIAGSYHKHKEMEFKSVIKGDLDLTGIGKEKDENSKKDEVPTETLADLLNIMRSQLTNEISDVKVSKRLTDSPCCLVSESNGMAPHIERWMQMQDKNYKSPKKVLEINPSHTLIKNLSIIKQNGAVEAKLNDWVEMLYDTALLAEGSPVRNSGEFAKRLTEVMQVATKA